MKLCVCVPKTAESLLATVAMIQREIDGLSHGISSP